ncbi:hypothetical protein BCR41DRAFT_373502 [Lobosporangium transversale]|uniref:Chitin-binding type-2 domain-containing protein n=1 Tax=Lobosporangium transversale TaxID=64571 RepID=A0A1Y2GDD5_9FUNG|nr:hypothetical protein BCR41DRAFT_373502 [Lobosporangium transversale]ORZ07750.1 hypothetical protein BCR41DRAFT_373502 [Lobosporangium transversale]|eukprot:XP_021878116.1 hypothetical protein BCR41DRAFT_373502 [Lobosporangium transversale]
MYFLASYILYRQESFGICLPKFRCPKLDGLYKNPKDCHSFYLCKDGVAYLKECPADLLWKDSLKYTTIQNIFTGSGPRYGIPRAHQAIFCITIPHIATCRLAHIAPIKSTGGDNASVGITACTDTSLYAKSFVRFTKPLSKRERASLIACESRRRQQSTSFKANIASTPPVEPAY